VQSASGLLGHVSSGASRNAQNCESFRMSYEGLSEAGWIDHAQQAVRKEGSRPAHHIRWFITLWLLRAGSHSRESALLRMRSA
jgi:hypothetical protein